MWLIYCVKFTFQECGSLAEIRTIVRALFGVLVSHIIWYAWAMSTWREKTIRFFEMHICVIGNTSRRRLRSIWFSNGRCSPYEVLMWYCRPTYRIVKSKFEESYIEVLKFEVILFFMLIILNHLVKWNETLITLNISYRGWDIYQYDYSSLGNIVAFL